MIRPVPFDRLLADGFEGLAVEHYEEVESDTDKLPFRLDVDRFRAFERAGILQCLGMYADHALVGYVLLIVSPTLHSSAPVAGVNAIYVVPEHRGRGVALLHAAEKHLKQQGIVKFAVTAKVSRNIGRRRRATLGDLLKRMGYCEEETTFGKLL